MPDSILSQIERRLIALHLPLARRKRALQELGEHREDLVRLAIEDGLSEIEAGIRANQSLGDPNEVAEKIVLAARESSWWGRHPVLGFCVVPFFAVALAITAAFWIVLRITSAPGPRFQYNVYSHAFVMSNVWTARVLVCHITQLAVVSGLASLFCKLAAVSAIERRWTFIACGICSVQGCLWMIFVSASGFSPPRDLWPIPTELLPIESAIIPLMITFFHVLRQRRLFLIGGQHA